MKTINNIIRRIKIHKLTPVLTEFDLELISFIEYKLSNLKQYTDTNNCILKDTILFGNAYKECIFRVDMKYKKIWIKGSGFYDTLLHKYNLSLDNIDIILKYFINKIYKEYDISDYTIYDSGLNEILNNMELID